MSTRPRGLTREHATLPPDIKGKTLGIIGKFKMKMIGKEGVQKWIGLAVTSTAGISILIATVVYVSIIIADMYPTTTTNSYDFTVDCTWNTWSAWETCSLTCGNGTQERNRTITQEALNNGTDCTGNETETQSCNTFGCPSKYQLSIDVISFKSNSYDFTVDCTWNTWSAWETCSVACGGGTQERNRTITQEALFNGTECTGNGTETQPCNGDCPGKAQLSVCVLLKTFCH